MKNLNLFIILIASCLISSCGSNEKIADFETDVKQSYKLKK